MELFLGHFDCGVDRPAPDDGFVIIVLRKMRWVVLAVIAPDLLTMHSAMQWHLARISVLEMHSLRYTSWTMEHAFYANSGGFVLESPEMRPFPITSRPLPSLILSHRGISSVLLSPKKKYGTRIKPINLQRPPHLSKVSGLPFNLLFERCKACLSVHWRSSP